MALTAAVAEVDAELQRNTGLSEANVSKLKEVFLVSSLEGETPVQDPKELFDAAEVLAIAVAKSDDMNMFETVVDQLLPKALGSSDCSERTILVLALYLLRMLATGRKAAFHGLKERLPDSVQTHPYVLFATTADNLISEGNHTKVLNLTPPHDLFPKVMRPLRSSVPVSVARAVEAAYEELPIADAIRRLTLPSREALEEFVSNRNAALVAAAALPAAVDRERTEKSILIAIGKAMPSVLGGYALAPEENVGSVTEQLEDLFVAAKKIGEMELDTASNEQLTTWVIEGDTVRLEKHQQNKREVPSLAIISKMIEYAIELEKII